MSSAMEYRVVWAKRPAWISSDALRYESVGPAKHLAGLTDGRVEWREPGGVWQTLTEGESETATRTSGGPGTDRKTAHASPSVSVPSVPEEKYVDPGNMHTRTLRRGRWY